jgi:hypothetical protein
MRKTTIYLPEPLDLELKAKSRRTGVPQAELIRTALRQSLDADGPPRPRSVGVAAVSGFEGRDDERELSEGWERKWTDRERARRDADA